MAVIPNYQPNIKTLYLPSTKDLDPSQQAWVKINLSPSTAGDVLLYNDFDGTELRFMKWLEKRIVEWNFTEADGTPLSITLENIQRMDKRDFDFLSMQQLESVPTLNSEEKKSSSSTSTPPVN